MLFAPRKPKTTVLLFASGSKSHAIYSVVGASA